MDNAAPSVPKPRTRITQARIKNAVNGARQAGLAVGRVEVEGGKIVLYAAGSQSNDSVSPLDEWRLKNGEG